MPQPTDYTTTLDVQLVAASQAGDMPAFEELVADTEELCRFTTMATFVASSEISSWVVGPKYLPQW